MLRGTYAPLPDAYIPELHALVAALLRRKPEQWPSIDEVRGMHAACCMAALGVVVLQEMDGHVGLGPAGRRCKAFLGMTDCLPPMTRC